MNNATLMYSMNPIQNIMCVYECVQKYIGLGLLLTVVGVHGGMDRVGIKHLCGVLLTLFNDTVQTHPSLALENGFRW